MPAFFVPFFFASMPASSLVAILTCSQYSRVRGCRLASPTLACREQMALETPAEDEFIDFTTLSGTLLDYHSLLSMLRTIAALIAWVITCREDSTLLITVPPLPREG